MNRKLILTLAVSGALAGVAGGAYAQEAPKPEDEKPKPELRQPVPQLEIAFPWFIAEDDEDKKPEQPAPKPELIA
jgi:hypothetical protein